MRHNFTTKSEKHWLSLHCTRHIANCYMSQSWPALRRPPAHHRKLRQRRHENQEPGKVAWSDAITFYFRSGGWPGAAASLPLGTQGIRVRCGKSQAGNGIVKLWTMFCWESFPDHKHTYMKATLPNGQGPQYTFRGQVESPTFTGSFWQQNVGNEAL